jgi:hypothetical protein
MAGAPVQLTQASTQNLAPLTVTTPNFAGANTAGNLIFYAFSYDASSAGTSEPTVAISDTVLNAYVKIASIWDGTNGLKTEIGYAKNIAGGTNAITATISGAGLPSTTFKAVAAWELSGLSATTPFTAGEFALANQTAATTLSSGNTPTLSAATKFAVGFSTVLHALVGTTNLTAGAGWTIQGANFWDFGFGASTDLFAALEYQNLSAATALAATFTATTSDNYNTAIVVFNLASGAPSFPPVPGSPNVMPGFQQHNALMVN